MDSITLQVEQDHVEGVARLADPVGAVTELIYNALDADATEVTVELERTELGGISKVRVIDNGHGMPAEASFSYFDKLGGSWKRTALVSLQKHRALHGRNGQGRVRAFALGQQVRWTTVGEGLDGAVRTVIEASRSAMRNYEIDVQGSTSQEPGTTVEVWGDVAHLDRLLNTSKVIGALTTEFALYLETYPDSSITYDGKKIDPGSAQVNSEDYVLDPVDDRPAPTLRVIEWHKSVTRELALCDAERMPLIKLRPEIQAPGFIFTAYLSWKGFEDRPHDLSLVDWDEDSPAARVVEQARDRLRQHFRDRVDARRQEQIREWQREDVYPYQGDAAEPTEVAERETFDTVATTIAQHIPKNHKAKRSILGLLKETLAAKPDHTHEILDRVFSLTRQEKEDLSLLLRRTSLTSLISTSTEVTDRLDFLRALELLLFDPAAKKVTRERDQLHKILENEAWVFGEEYSLMVSERGLSEVLRKHLRLLRAPEPADTHVRLPDGGVGRVDLMLSKTTVWSQRPHHLVVELKRPNLTLGMEQFSQLVSYATAVTQDERFRSTDAMWDFWLIGNKLDSSLHSMARQPNLPPGQVSFAGPTTRLWVREWSEILQECKQRLHFYRSRLDYQSTDEHALDYLVRKHADAVPTVLLPDDEFREEEVSTEASGSVPQPRVSDGEAVMGDSA
ncbi:ATP-binding protein [Streptacidiphilus sp. N1-10]|uniref:ATP-binding protein n=1 Tax=Streptacidiphilus jeojiensis TaxID=3229225 RepID=A0ABV6XY11_9ACTN